MLVFGSDDWESGGVCKGMGASGNLTPPRSPCPVQCQHWVYAQRHAKAVLGVGGNADGVCGGTRQVIFNVAAAL